MMSTVMRRGAAVVLAGAVACMVTGWAVSLPVARGASPFVYKKIVDSTMQVPTEALGVTYDFFGRPAINQSNIAYRTGFTDLSNVLRHEVERVTPAGTILLVQKATPSGPSTGIISDPTIYGTSVAYSALRTTAQNTGAIYQFGSSLVTDGLNNEEAPTIYDGKVVYPRRSITIGSGPNNIHIAVTSNGAASSTILVDHNTLVPGGGGQFFGQYDAYLDHNLNSVNNNGSVAFLGIGSSGPGYHGIYRWDQQTNSVTVIADPSTPIPGQAGNFTTANLWYRTPTSGFNGVVGNSFNFPQSFYTSSALDVSSRVSLYGKAVSFNYDDGPRAGIYQRVTGPLTKIADINTPHPTVGGNFKEFFESSTVGGSVAFTATDATGIERGLFLAHCGMILQVAAAGQVIDGKGVASVDLGHRGLSVKAGTKWNSGLELAFFVSFTNGTQGIYTASIPQICMATPVLIGAGVGFGQAQAGTVLGSPSFTSPVFDDLTSVLRVQMEAHGGGSPAVFGGSTAADVLGVDGLPGNNPGVIDYVMQGGLVAPESMSMSYNQPMLIDGVHLHDFGATDSATLQVGGILLHVDGATYPDGIIPLPAIALGNGQVMTVSWDAANGVGDGFSFGGVLATPVPEPGSPGMVFAAGSLVAACWRGARRGRTLCRG
jgi:hypothetical protein